MFSVTKQLDARDCGPACLHMVSRHHGRQHNLALLREYCHITREGVSLLGISDAAEKIGFRTMGVKISYEKLANEVPMPCIAHWKQRHFVVVYEISGKKKDKLKVADPAHGLITYSREEFLKGWISTKNDDEDMGVCLLLEPTPDFYTNEEEKANKKNFRFLFSYLRPHRKLLVQLILGMLLGSVIQLIFPFLTQAVVDVGINTRDLNFITLVLIAANSKLPQHQYLLILTSIRRINFTHDIYHFGFFLRASLKESIGDFVAFGIKNQV